MSPTGSSFLRRVFSFLPLGRLFWKFLVFFFLAQMTAVLGVGLAIWATMPERLIEAPAFSAPRSKPTARLPAPPDFPFGQRGAHPPPPPPGPELPIVHLAAGAVVSLLFATLLAAYVSRPIRRLREALQQGASGELVPGVTASMGARRDELADLGRDFDRMARHTAQLMAAQRRLLHDVSHELRSPLARLNAIVGLIRQQPQNLDAQLLRLEHESMRMDRLLSELLTLSRLESGSEGRRGEPVEAVDLKELLEEVIEDAAPESAQAGCRIEFVGPAGCCAAPGDRELLYRLFDNLLRNALTHAAEGGWAGVSVSAGDDAIEICIKDNGPGVPANDLAQLFSPFFRSIDANGRKGHGLGLAIARQIVDNHHGRIAAANRDNGGLQVSVHLPRALG